MATLSKRPPISDWKPAASDSWYVADMTAVEFITGMLSLGRPLEFSVVAATDPAGTVGRASRQDVELPMHQDGIYSAALAAVQGGHYVANPDIAWVGLYCDRAGAEPCFTVIGDLDGKEIGAVDLKAGQALVFDNRRIMHARRGPVGSRMLLRFWIGQSSEDTE